MLPGNTVFYRLYGDVCLLINALMMGLVLRRMCGRREGMLAALLYFAFAQVDIEHNTLVSYLGSRQLDLALLLGSIYLFWDYLEGGKKRKSRLIGSVILYFFSFCAYENFLLFGLLHFLIALRFVRREEQERPLHRRLLRAISDVLPYLLTAILYVGAYVLWDIYFPNDYEGATLMQPFSPVSLFQINLTLTVSRFPAIRAIRTILGRGLWQDGTVWSYVSFAGLLISGMLTLVIYRILKGGKDTAQEKTAVFFAMGLFLLAAFLPNLVFAATQKAYDWVILGDTRSYISSNTSYQCLILALAAVLPSLAAWVKGKGKALRLLCSGIFLVSLAGEMVLTGINNAYFRAEAKKVSGAFENFTAFLHSDTYTDLGGKDLLCIDGQQFGNYFFDASFLGYYANGTRPDDPDTPTYCNAASAENIPGRERIVLYLDRPESGLVELVEMGKPAYGTGNRYLVYDCASREATAYALPDNCDQSIGYAKDQPGTNRLAGWEAPEAAGCWAAGPASVFYFSTGASTEGSEGSAAFLQEDATLRMQILGSAGYHNHLLVNGYDLGRIPDTEEPGEMRIRIPAERMENGTNILMLVPEEEVLPYAQLHPESKDQRLLNLFLQEVELITKEPF